MSDNPDEEPTKVIIDYTALDEATGFKRADLTIWEAYKKNVLLIPEADRPDPENWAEEWAEENGYDKKRVRAVTILGIYGGPRDEFNQRTGCGKAYYNNGDTYEGDFLEGKKNGQGHYVFVKQGKGETDKLIEKVRKNKPNEESDVAFIQRCAIFLHIGVLIVEAALEYGYLPCYHGDYVKGIRSGQGVIKNKDGSIYKGDWIANKRQGQGLFYYVNGDMYSGEWLDGIKHGYGAYRFHNEGGELRGHWVKGNIVEGQWIMSDGTYYEGKFDKKNRPCDLEGVIHYPKQGLAQTGVFKWDRWAPLGNMMVNYEIPVDENAWTE